MFSPLDSQSAKQAARGGFSTPRSVFARGARAAALFLLFMLAAICTSCGSIASDPPPPVTVNVVPNSMQIFAGASEQFTAVVQNAASTAVNWQVNTVPSGNSTVGTIDSSGLYKAPNAVPTQPAVTVTAVLQSDPTKSGSSNVIIEPDSFFPFPLPRPVSRSRSPGSSRYPLLDSPTAMPRGRLTVFPAL